MIIMIRHLDTEIPMENHIEIRMQTLINRHRHRRANFRFPRSQRDIRNRAGREQEKRIRQKVQKKNDVYFSKGNSKKKSYKKYDYDFDEDRWWFDLDPVTFLLGVIIVAIVLIFVSFFFH